MIDTVDLSMKANGEISGRLTHDLVKGMTEARTMLALFKVSKQ